MGKKLIISFDEYLDTVEKLAIDVNKSFKPTVLVGIMRGGAQIIDILSRIFKLPTAYIVIQSYDLSDTGLTLNKSIDWLKKYEPVKNYIKDIKTACLWKKKSSKFNPDYCPVMLDSDPWIVQPTEHYEELSIDKIILKQKKG